MLNILLSFFICIFCFADSLFVGKTISIVSNPVINTVEYSIGDTVGSVGTLANIVSPAENLYQKGYSGIIAGAILFNKNLDSPNFNIIYFSSNPTASTITNNEPLVIADTDLSKIICVIEIKNNINYFDNSSSQATSQNCAFQLTPPNNNLYYAIMIKDITSFLSSSDLILKTYIYQD